MLNTLIISWISLYGSPLAAALILLGAAGLPLPTSMVVVASGAFIRQDVMNGFLTLALALSGTVLGDSFTYWVGRLASTWIEKRYGASPNWLKARALFKARGGAAVFLTRWLFTGIASPTGVIAGSSRYPFRKFLVYDIAGELLWLLAYGSLGWAFSSQWQALSDTLAEFSGLALVAAMLAGALFFLVRRIPAVLRVKRVSENLL